MRLYIGGPITDLPNENRAAFAYAFKRLLEAGHHPVNPHLLEANITVDLKAGMAKAQIYRATMPGDIVALALCDGMVLLPGWEQSRGTGGELNMRELFEIPQFAPAYTSDEFPGDLDEWMDVIIDMITIHQRELLRESYDGDWMPSKPERTMKEN